MSQFSRTVAPETSHGPTLIALVQHYKWQKVSMVTTTEGLWFQSGLGLTKQLQAAGIEVQKPSAFEPGQFQAAMLREMKRSGFRISMLLAYDIDMTVVADSATLEGMNGAGYAWILTEGLVARAPGDMEGWLYVQVFLPSVNMQAFAAQVTEYSHSRFGIPLSSAQDVDLTYSQTLYDAVMLYAHAATKVLSEGGDLRDGQAVTAAARNTTFVGVGGSVVALDSRGDRIESYEMMNYVLDSDGAMGSVAVGVFNSTVEEYVAYSQAVLWPGSTLEVPLSYFSGALMLSWHAVQACNMASHPDSTIDEFLHRQLKYVFHVIVH